MSKYVWVSIYLLCVIITAIHFLLLVFTDYTLSDEMSMIYIIGFLGFVGIGVHKELQKFTKDN